VIDFKLPEMNGLDLLAALRGRGVQLPAILVTSHPTNALRRRAAEETTPIIEKPLFGDALTDAIRSMLGRGGAEAR
jgi:FixJ family two-component response regulator